MAQEAGLFSFQISTTLRRSADVRYGSVTFSVSYNLDYKEPVIIDSLNRSSSVNRDPIHTESNIAHTSAATSSLEGMNYPHKYQIRP